jgi:hypothetical protein
MNRKILFDFRRNCLTAASEVDQFATHSHIMGLFGFVPKHRAGWRK